jgi:hypothetical protein
MKITKPKQLLIGALIVVLISVPIYLYQWKLGSDRAACLLNMHNIYVTIYSQAGMENIMAGRPIPDGIRGLLKRADFLPSLPVCPSGGNYSFFSETSYSAAGVNKTIRCSHANDLGHVYPDDKRRLDLLAEQDAGVSTGYK